MSHRIYAFRTVFTSYVYLKTWWNYSRHYETDIQPFELLSVDPRDVELFQPKETRTAFSQPDYIPEVVSGNWDTDAKSIKEHGLYGSLHDRFINRTQWEKTDLYQRVTKRISSGEQKFGCNTKKEFERRLESIDKLYENLQEYGFHSQRELEQNKEVLKSQIPSVRPPETHDVTVNIGRDGRLILYEGHHRLIISQIIGINTIPVRIKARHSKWMEYRDRISRSKVDDDHPDLKQL